MADAFECARCHVIKARAEFQFAMNKRGCDGVCRQCRTADESGGGRFTPAQVERMCKSKRRYPTHLDAIEASRKPLRRERFIRIYECPVCRGFHLTKRPIRQGVDR